MPIYTKQGDLGETSLIGGKRVKKSTLRVDAYGTVDELNSVIGVVITSLGAKGSRLETELQEIQHDLFEIGSELANPEAKELTFLTQRVSAFETMIDELTQALPELTHFILPGGSMTGAQLHMARTIARRAERRIVSLNDREPIDGGIIKYINRLSDLFFTMARYANHMMGETEIIWEAKEVIKENTNG
jgi:cob(I)alamin adenosyltransferase